MSKHRAGVLVSHRAVTGAGSRIEFTGSHGEPLAARLDMPAGTPRAYVLFAHCFTCSKESSAAARVARALTAHQLAVLRFDFTGLGDSGGDFGNTNFTSNIDDLIHAASYLRENFAAPALLVGHSLGGAAALAAAGRLPEVRAVATIGAPADPAHVTHLFHDARAEIERLGEAEVELAGRSFRIRRQFLDDIASHPQAERITHLRRPLLVLHSPNDEIVGIDNARLIFDSARHSKSFIAIDGADHLLSRRQDAEYVANLLAVWAERYVGDAASPRRGTPARRARGSGEGVVS